MKTKPLSCLGWVVGIATGFATPVFAVTKTIDPTVTVVIEAVLLFLMALKYYKLKSESVTLDNLYHGNVPMISTLSYVMNSKKRTEFNTFDVQHATIQYRYKKVQGSTGLYMQTVIWEFEIENGTSDPITRALMMVSKSVYSSFADISVTAVDMETGRNLLVAPRMVNGAQKYIAVVFDGEGIEPDAVCRYRLCMEWTKPSVFREPEFFIVDPQNYSINTRRITTVFSIDDDAFEGVPVTYLALNRNSLSYSNDECNLSMEQDGNGGCVCEREFRPQQDKLYLIRIGHEEK